MPLRELYVLLYMSFPEPLVCLASAALSAEWRKDIFSFAARRRRKICDFLILLATIISEGQKEDQDR